MTPAPGQSSPVTPIPPRQQSASSSPCMGHEPPSEPGGAGTGNQTGFSNPDSNTPTASVENAPNGPLSPRRTSSARRHPPCVRIIARASEPTIKNPESVANERNNTHRRSGLGRLKWPELFPKTRGGR